MFIGTSFLWAASKYRRRLCFWGDYMEEMLQEYITEHQKVKQRLEEVRKQLRKKRTMELMKRCATLEEISADLWAVIKALEYKKYGI